MKYHSKRTEQFMKKHDRNLMIENFLKSCLLMLFPIGLVVLIILDWLRVFRISWLIG